MLSSIKPQGQPSLAAAESNTKLYNSTKNALYVTIGPEILVEPSRCNICSFSLTEIRIFNKSDCLNFQPLQDPLQQSAADRTPSQTLTYLNLILCLRMCSIQASTKAVMVMLRVWTRASSDSGATPSRT